MRNIHLIYVISITVIYAIEIGILVYFSYYFLLLLIPFFAHSAYAGKWAAIQDFKWRLDNGRL